MASGRPTDYKPEYCALMQSLGKEGKGPTALASSIGVSKQVLYDWAKIHPEFLDSMQAAKTSQEEWLLSAGRGMIMGERGSDRLLQFFLNCNHGYKETQTIDVNKTTVEVSFTDVQDDPSPTTL
jgi:hypothetical protein